MTTRTPPTAGDIAGTTARGQAAYNQRRRDLASKGILIPDVEPGDAELQREDPKAYRQVMADRLEVSRLESALDVRDGDPDDSWMWPGGRRPQ
jgi:hypothetical protein